MMRFPASMLALGLLGSAVAFGEEAATREATRAQVAPKAAPAPKAKAMVPRLLTPKPGVGGSASCEAGTDCAAARRELLARSQQTRADYCVRNAQRYCGICGEGTRCEPTNPSDATTLSCACVGASASVP